MDYTTIIFIIIIVLVIYAIYTYLFMSSIIINKPIDLKSPSGSRLSYAAARMKTPNSTRYYYECWVFVESNFPTDSSNVIFNRGNYLSLVLTGSTLSLYTNGSVNNATGIYDISKPSGGAPGAEIAKITTSFPFQKWVQIIISVDGNLVDIYLDGKLIKTFTGANIATDSTTDITVGNKFTVGKLNQFSYWPNTMDPQTAWNKYIQGNGQYGFGNYFNKFKVDMALSRNNEQLFNFSLM